MSLGEQLDEARARVVLLERQAAAATCAQLGRHRWKSIGGANCGCKPTGSCSVPVLECEVCHDCDYGESTEAAAIRAACTNER